MVENQVLVADTIGKLIDGPVQRDAIHVAIVPVVAAEVLVSGQDIGFVRKDIVHVGVVDSPIGIVDPFLKIEHVSKGKRFWMFMYPNTITSMRHDWAHPAFLSVLDDSQKPLGLDYVRSREWLEVFAAENGNMTFEETLDAARDWVERRRRKHEGGRFESSYAGDEFWNHFEKVTEQKVAENDRGSFFSCSC